MERFADERVMPALLWAQRAKERALQSIVDLVSTELAVCRTLCWLAKNAQGQKRQRHVELARKAHQRATKTLAKLDVQFGWVELVTQLDELSREFVRLEWEQVPKDQREAAE